jgi:hypothetical protein
MCKGEFLLDYHYGRPREHCYDCQPPGFRLIKPAGRVRLRRIEAPSRDDERNLGA